jgi:ABC-type glycerol-3-phosphate transport system substrate-binding protein
MYKLYKTQYGNNGVMRFNADGSLTSFLEDPANTDYVAYLKWLEEGNTPEPAEVTE